MTGRLLLPALIVSLVLGSALAVSPAGAQSPTKPGKYRVYLGTYTGPKSKGIYVCEFDATSGKLSKPEVAAEVVNPSFVALHPSGNYLYAVGELADFGGKKAGAVSAFAIDRESGKLKLLNQQPTKGAGPCHVSVHPKGTCVAIATYTGGTVCAYPVNKDGTLGEMTGFAQHEGMGSTSRQKGPHAHSANFDAAGRYLFVADLGLDKMIIYQVDAKGNLQPHGETSVPPGSGPRHFAFHPSGKFAFVINEMGMTITTFKYNAEKGELTRIGEVSTIPEGAEGKNFSTAEVQVHPSGKLVYGSNRGQNSIAVFTFDAQTGLKRVQNQGEGVDTPRNFGIDPTGAYLLVANQATHNVIVFKIDQASGKLSPTDQKIEVGSPVCIKFLAVE